MISDKGLRSDVARSCGLANQPIFSKSGSMNCCRFRLSHSSSQNQKFENLIIPEHLFSKITKLLRIKNSNHASFAKEYLLRKAIDHIRMGRVLCSGAPDPCSGYRDYFVCRPAIAFGYVFRRTFKLTVRSLRYQYER